MKAPERFCHALVLLTALFTGCGGATPSSASVPLAATRRCPIGAEPTGESRCADVAPVSAGAYLGCAEAGACPPVELDAPAWEIARVEPAQARDFCRWRGGEVQDASSEHGFRCGYASDPTSARYAWDRPWCLGYAPSGGYACLHYDLVNELEVGHGTTDVELLFHLIRSEGLLEPRDVDPPSWDGLQRVIFVPGQDLADGLQILDVDTDEGGMPILRRHRSLGAALAEVRERGYVGEVHAVVLTAGEWTPVADAWVRVVPRYRSGGGVSESLSHEVEVSCTPAQREPLDRLEGTETGAAWAFWAYDGAHIVVATIPWSGGEGTVRLATHYGAHSRPVCPPGASRPD